MFMEGDHGHIPAAPPQPFNLYDGHHSHSPIDHDHNHQSPIVDHQHHGGHQQPKMPLTKSHSQPSLSEMLAMNRDPLLFEQFQAMNQEQKRQSVAEIDVIDEVRDTVFTDI